MIAKEMGLPWRAVEAMHWSMGCEDMASRANVSVFQPHSSASSKPSSNVPLKRKNSGSPQTGISDSSAGPGDVGTGSGYDFPRSESVDTSGRYPRRRSSSRGSRRNDQQDSPRGYIHPASHPNRLTGDEHRHSRARHDSGEIHLHEHRWRRREEREDTGTSYQSQRRQTRSVSSDRNSGVGDTPREPMQVRDG